VRRECRQNLDVAAITRAAVKMNSPWRVQPRPQFDLFQCVRPSLIVQHHLLPQPRIKATSATINPMRYNVAPVDTPPLASTTTPRCKMAKNSATLKNGR